MFEVLEVVPATGEYPAKGVVLLSKRAQGGTAQVPFAASLRLSDAAAKVVTVPGKYSLDFEFAERAGVSNFDGVQRGTVSVQVVGILAARPVKL